MQHKLSDIELKYIHDNVIAAKAMFKFEHRKLMEAVNESTIPNGNDIVERDIYSDRIKVFNGIIKAIDENYINDNWINILSDLCNMNIWWKEYLSESTFTIQTINQLSSDVIKFGIDL